MERVKCAVTIAGGIIFVLVASIVIFAFETMLRGKRRWKAKADTEDDVRCGECCRSSEITDDPECIFVMCAEDGKCHSRYSSCGEGIRKPEQGGYGDDGVF